MKQNYFTAFLLLLAFLSPMKNYSQNVISIGNGTSSGTSSPIASYYNSSATESIYTGTEIGAIGGITKIGYTKSSGASTTNPYVQIYMKTTSLTTFGTTAYIIGIQNLTDYTLVFEGELPNESASGLMEVTLARTFNFSDTTKNLSVLTIGSTCISSGRPQYKYTTTPSKMTAVYTDGRIGCDGNTDFNEYSSFSPVWERPNLTLTLSPLSTATFDKTTVITFVSNNKLHISSGDDIIKSVELFDLIGRRLSSSEVNSYAASINLDVSNQVIIAKINSENNIIVTKKILL